MQQVELGEPNCFLEIEISIEVQLASPRRYTYSKARFSNVYLSTLPESSRRGILFSLHSFDYLVASLRNLGYSFSK
jgi:hypothetical protein